MVAPLITSAVAERFMRLVAIRPPMLREPALVTAPGSLLSVALPRKVRALLIAVRVAWAFASSRRDCSGVETVTVLLTVAFTVPALIAFTPTPPAVAVTVAASIRARVAWVAAKVKNPLPRMASMAIPTTLSASLSLPVRPSGR